MIVYFYLNTCLIFTKPYAVVLSAFCALKWVHDLMPYGIQGNPVDSTLSRNIVEASKRVFSRPVRKKEPITPDMIC